MSDTPGRNQRLDAVVPVRFADAREFLVEYSSNISMGGVFVRTSSPAPFGTVVRLSLELPGSGQSVPVTGQVAFVLPPDQAARQGKVPGMGVRFARLDPAVQETLASYVASLQRKSKGRVLLVDDDPLMLTQLGDTLRRHNLNVVTASSAIKALEVIRFGGIDFIISDINMPRMDGFEFRDNLRNNPKTANIPFVFLTSSITDGDRQVATELGVQHFLVKPFNEPQLVDLLRQVLGEGAFVADPAGGGDAAQQEAAQRQQEEKASRQKQQQRRIVEIAYRKFVALGMDTRFTADERGVFGQLVFRNATIQDPASGQRLERAGFYSVGHDRAKPFWPRALATLPLIPILDIPDGATLEKMIASSFAKRVDQVRQVKSFLDRMKIPTRYEPATLRVLGHVKIQRDEVEFSVRDAKTIFLESINGRSFGSVAAGRARLVDISEAKSGVDVEIELETVCRNLQAELANRAPAAAPPQRALSRSGDAIAEMDLGDLSAPDPVVAPASAPAPAAAAAPRPAPATAPAPVSGTWIGESEGDGASPAAAPLSQAEPAMESLLLEPVDAPADALGALSAPEAPAAGEDPFAEAAPAAPAMETMPGASADGAPPAAELDWNEAPAMESWTGPAPEAPSEAPGAEAGAPAGDPPPAEDWNVPAESAPATEAAPPEMPAEDWTETAASAPLAPAAEEPAPVEDWSAATAPGEAPAPVETAPDEAAPVETAPVEPAPEEAAPVEDAPVESSEIATSAEAPPSEAAAPAEPGGISDFLAAVGPAPEAAAPPEPAPAEWTEPAAETWTEAVPDAASDTAAVPEMWAGGPEAEADPAAAAPFGGQEIDLPAGGALEETHDGGGSAAVGNELDLGGSSADAPLEMDAAAAPAPGDEAAAWAEEWTGDEKSATPLWTMQPEDLAAPAGNPPPSLEESAPAPVAASSEPQPPDSANSTVLICNNCGQYYTIGENVEDERLLLLCPACIAKGA